MIDTSNLLAVFFASLSSQSPNTLQAKKIHMSVFQRVIFPKPLLEITSTDIAIFAQKGIDEGYDYKKPKPLKRISIKQYLLTIKRFFEFAYFENLYDLKDYKRITKFVKDFSFEKGEIGIRLTTKEVEILLTKAAKKTTLYFACWFILNFAVRITELRNLKISDFDFKKQLITIRLSKGKKTRRIPIYDVQIEPLKNWLEVRESMLPIDSTEDSFLILARTGKCPSYVHFKYHFKKWSKETGIRIHAHRLRRTSACIHFYDLHLDITEISFMLGHASISTTYIYLGISEADTISGMRVKMKGKTILPAAV